MKLPFRLFPLVSTFTNMGMKTIPFALFLFLALLSSLLARKPNVIYVMADDLGYAELGSYGQEKINTPRIDELASEGMRFTRNYSGNAVCAPSRCVLMTGKHPGHAFIRNNGEVKPEGQRPIPKGEVTIAELLKKQGYATGAFGKWGLGGPGSEGDPVNQGFDRFFGYNCQRHAHSYYPNYLWSNRDRISLDNEPPVPGHASLPKGADPADPRSYEVFKGKDYAPDRINEQALAFIRKNKDKPFYLYYPTVIPQRSRQGNHLWRRFTTGSLRRGNGKFLGRRTDFRRSLASKRLGLGGQLRRDARTAFLYGNPQGDGFAGRLLIRPSVDRLHREVGRRHVLIGHEFGQTLHHLRMLGREILALRWISDHVVKLDLERVVILSFAKHFLTNAFPFAQPNGLLAPVTGKLAIEELSLGLLLAQQGGGYAYPVAIVG